MVSETVEIFLMNNVVLLGTGAVVLLLVLECIRIVQLHGVNKKMRHMMKKIEKYMEIISCEQETEEEKHEEREEIVRYIERELEKGKEQEKKVPVSKEDEAVFDQVVREYFS